MRLIERALHTTVTALALAVVALFAVAPFAPFAAEPTAAPPGVAHVPPATVEAPFLPIVRGCSMVRSECRYLASDSRVPYGKVCRDHKTNLKAAIREAFEPGEPLRIVATCAAGPDPWAVLPFDDRQVIIFEDLASCLESGEGAFPTCWEKHRSG